MDYERKNQNQNPDSESGILSRAKTFGSTPEGENSSEVGTGAQSEYRLSEKGGYEKTSEPTRYGDWEIAGRCIDF